MSPDISPNTHIINVMALPTSSENTSKASPACLMQSWHAAGIHWRRGAMKEATCWLFPLCSFSWLSLKSKVLRALENYLQRCLMPREEPQQRGHRAGRCLVSPGFQHPGNTHTCTHVEPQMSHPHFKVSSSSAWGIWCYLEVLSVCVVYP